MEEEEGEPTAVAGVVPKVPVPELDLMEEEGEEEEELAGLAGVGDLQQIPATVPETAEVMDVEDMQPLEAPALGEQPITVEVESADLAPQTPVKANDSAPAPKASPTGDNPEPSLPNSDVGSQRFSPGLRGLSDLSNEVGFSRGDSAFVHSKAGVAAESSPHVRFQPSQAGAASSSLQIPLNFPFFPRNYTTNVVRSLVDSKTGVYPVTPNPLDAAEDKDNLDLDMFHDFQSGSKIRLVLFVCRGLHVRQVFVLYAR
jgi:hypothetical protein